MRICEVMGCDREHLARGMCSMHYKRWQVYRETFPGTPPDKKRKRSENIGKKCSIASCDRDAKRRGLCLGHYQRFMSHGETFPQTPLIVRHGRHINSTGYAVIGAKGHPNGNAAGAIMEHIKIMSDYIGRPLRKGETVHHKNGIRDNNEIQNLELWSGNHPRGSRVSDLIDFANEVISKYGSNPEKWRC